MKKTFILLSIFLLSITSYAQQIEFGAFGGYDYNNIVNAEINEGRAVIGKAYWDVSYGGIITYYFKSPDSGPAKGRLSLIYKNVTKGSKSEEIKDAKYEFDSHLFGMLIGVGREIGNGFLLYADVGIGYTTLNSDDIYKGTADELLAFPKMEDYLVSKGNEMTFLFDMGLEKIIIKDHLKLFFEMNTNPAINKFNDSEGRYRNQGIGFSLGAKYFINLNKE